MAKMKINNDLAFCIGMLAKEDVTIGPDLGRSPVG
jgi:hypothetical protein